MKASSDRERQEEEGVTREPLLPIEKKLIGWSLGLGLALLFLLVWLTRVVLPAG